MALSDLYIQPQDTPDDLERGKDNLLSCPVFTATGAPATVSAGTFSLYDAGGLAVVSAQAVTISGGVATYTVLAASLPTSRRFEEGWQERWALTIGGEVHTFDRDAALVARRLYPVLTDAAVVGMSATGAGGSDALKRILSKRGPGGFQAEREESWHELKRMLMSVQRWPALILNAWALADVHKYLARRKVLENGRTDLPGGNFEVMAAENNTLFDQAWARLRFSYDESGDGAMADSDGQVTKGHPILIGGGRDAWGQSVSRGGGGLW